MPTEREDANPLDYLSSVPLTSQQREMLTAKRFALGWTQIELAKKLKVSPAQMSQFETGWFPPSRELLTRWCELLGLVSQVEVKIEITDPAANTQ